MYKATKGIYFCYGHRLLNYGGKCKNLHGHNAKAEIELESETLDHRQMVSDFEDIERVVTSWIDENLDHRMLLSKDDPILPVLQERGVLCYVMDGNPTAEALAKVIFDYAAAQGFPVTRVSVWETESSYATYEGSHK
ncbi:MAG: 6-carboxytetrahydropterin synthase [candidate division WOR-3 bacterium]